jgi:putative tryptophan/tyrosine transport system substrate-binding protein
MERWSVKRREFLTFLGCAAAWPLDTRAQQRSMPVIGYLGGTTFEMTRGYVAAFHRGLADTGFTEGRNVAIEYRWAEVTTIAWLHWRRIWCTVT